MKKNIKLLQDSLKLNNLEEEGFKSFLVVNDMSEKELNNYRSQDL